MRYALIDSGDQKKFERFGGVTLVRPCPQALWRPGLDHWPCDRSFSREDDDGGWRGQGFLDGWVCEHEGLRFRLSPTDFGHVGLFPEHSLVWKWASGEVFSGASVLNLFAYSGAATLSLARAGAEVCHVDASLGMVKWARENAQLNGLESRPIRWIVDDVMKFLKREIRRGKRYDGILLDPPSFGRGAKGEVFKFERDIHQLLSLCHALLSTRPLFVICTSHTPGVTPVVMRHLIEEVFGSGVDSEEMLLQAEQGRSVPAGVYGRWRASC